MSVILEFDWNLGLQGKGGDEKRGWSVADSCMSFVDFSSYSYETSVICKHSVHKHSANHDLAFCMILHFGVHFI